jgi:hypothetical protein
MIPRDKYEAIASFDCISMPADVKRVMIDDPDQIGYMYDDLFNNDIICLDF